MIRVHPSSRQKPLPSDPDSSPSNPSPGYQFQPTYLPGRYYQPTPTPASKRLPVRQVRWSESTWRRFKEIEKLVARRGLVSGSKGGGRPPVSDAAMELLIDSYQKEVQDRAARTLGLKHRVRDVRGVDEQARRGLEHIFEQKGRDSLVTYRPVDGALRAAYPQHRPPQRHVDTLRFVQEGLIAPYYVARTIDGTPPVPVPITDPHPLFVPTYAYGAGILLRGDP